MPDTMVGQIPDFPFFWPCIRGDLSCMAFFNETIHNGYVFFLE
jgi:hypothetical protein